MPETTTFRSRAGNVPQQQLVAGRASKSSDSELYLYEYEKMVR